MNRVKSSDIVADDQIFGFAQHLGHRLNQFPERL